MIFVVIYRSEDGKENLVSLVAAKSYMRALAILGLSHLHRDWTMYTKKQIRSLLKEKEVAFENLLSEGH